MYELYEENVVLLFVLQKFLFYWFKASALHNIRVENFHQLPQWSVNFMSQHENSSYGFTFGTGCLLNVN